MVLGVVLVALGGGLTWLFVWAARQALPAPSGYELLTLGIAALMSATVVGFTAWGVWLFGHGVRLNAGIWLLGDDAALRIHDRGGRERARIPWHEIRALSAQLPIAGSDRTTYYLDTGDRVIIWVESLFDSSAVRAQHALLRRAVVTRAGVPLRDVTRAYTRVSAVLRDQYRWFRGAQSRIDDATPTETDRTLWAPHRMLTRIEQYLLVIGLALAVVGALLEPTAFMLQRLLG